MGQEGVGGTAVHEEADPGSLSFWSSYRSLNEGEAQGRRLIVVEPDEVKDDLVADMIDVLTSFCARLYDRRSARRRAEKAIKAATEP